MTELDAGLVGRDRDLLVEFYTDAMGFTLAQELEVGGFGTVLRLRRDRARLKLFFPLVAVDPPTAAEPDPWHRPGGWRYAGLTLDTVDALHALASRAHR